MRIGILTGGGDVPGLNPCIKAVVDARGRATATRSSASGAAGPACSTPTPTTRSRRGAPGPPRPGGGCAPSTAAAAPCLHTSRTNPGRVRRGHVPAFLAGRAVGEAPFDFTAHALRVLESQGIDVLIAIGGDDTLSYALRLHDEGVPVIAIPKTMDNDVHGTDYCIGFSTAVTRGVAVRPQPAHQHRLPRAHRRRRAVRPLQRRDLPGHRYLAGVDRAVISEVPVDINHLAELLMADKARPTRRNYAMMTISEGAVVEGGEMVLSGEDDAYGHRKLGGIGVEVGEML